MVYRRLVRPIITLLTDFGLRDSYVAEMKAAVYTRCPDATVVDITHQVPPQNITAGGLQLERAVRAFPAGTIHVAVIDPGVGTSRRLLCCHVAGQTLFVPDNGLVSWTHWRLGPVEANELRWRPAQESATFHGRDILAPAAAMLATNTLPFDAIGPANEITLSGPKPATALSEAVAIDIDIFGNVVTNVFGDLVKPGLTACGSVPLHRTYGDVPRGQPLALIGSSGLLEIAVHAGNAAEMLGLKIGDKVPLA